MEKDTHNEKRQLNQIRLGVNLALANGFGNLQKCMDYSSDDLDLQKYVKHAEALIADLQDAIESDRK